MMLPRLSLHSARRPAFTLTELLVAIAIISVLAGLVSTFMPGMLQRQQTAAGASQLQGYLQVARYRAIRDRVPTGVRLFDNGSGFLTKAQSIQQPDDFIGGTLMTWDGTVPPTLVREQMLKFEGVDLFGGFASDPSLWPVRPGDHLEIQGSGLVTQIIDIQQTNPSPPVFRVVLQSPLPNQITTKTSVYRIIREPRPIGEDAMELPLNIAIDRANSVTPSGGAELDVLFSPTGAVLTTSPEPRFIFWVRDTGYTSPLDGNPTLIVVYSRSGLVAAYEVDTLSGNPFSKVK